MRNSESYFVLEGKALRVISLKFVEILIGSLNKKEIVDGISKKEFIREGSGRTALSSLVMYYIKSIEI